MSGAQVNWLSVIQFRYLPTEAATPQESPRPQFYVFADYLAHHGAWLQCLSTPSNASTSRFVTMNKLPWPKFVRFESSELIRDAIYVGNMSRFLSTLRAEIR
jgi:hypothetical protein